MKIDVRCGVLDGGEPCRRKVGKIEREGFMRPSVRRRRIVRVMYFLED